MATTAAHRSLMLRYIYLFLDPTYCISSKRADETRTIIVDMAAIVGSMKSRKALNMCFVNVALEPPETKIDMITSSKDVRNESNNAVTTENLICGNVIMKNAFARVAPRLLATFS